MVLMSSATPAELVDPELPPRRLLFRLFHEDGVRVFDTQSLEARCRCSRERIVRILRSFPQEDIDEMREEPVTTVTCDSATRNTNSLPRIWRRSIRSRPASLLLSAGLDPATASLMLRESLSSPRCWPGVGKIAGRMLEIVHLTKTFGPIVAVDDVSLWCRPVRCSGFSDPTAPANRRR